MKFYDRKQRDICATLDRLCASQARRIAAQPSAQIVRGAINLQHAVLSEYVWTLGTPFGLSANSAWPALLSTVHRNTFWLFSALKLTELGLYAPARVLLRPVFEGLIIGKYCAVSGDERLLRRWSAGEPVSVAGEVFSRLWRPDPLELRGFWRHLCHYAHATAYAQQPKATPDAQDTWETLWLIIILLHMNYHLLGSHLLTRGMVYYSRQYGNQVQARADRKLLTSVLKDCRGMLPKDSRVLIRDYRATWVLGRTTAARTVSRTRRE